MYKLILNSRNNTIDAVSIQNENIETIIPFDQANTDYQAYLKWVSEGGVPLPADE
jgi:hypothetical protein